MRDDTAFGTGNLPKFMDDLFQTRLSQADVSQEAAAAMHKAMQGRLDGVLSRLPAANGPSDGKGGTGRDLAAELA